MNLYIYIARVRRVRSTYADLVMEKFDVFNSIGKHGSGIRLTKI